MWATSLLVSLWLRSASAFLCLVGRRSLRTCTSEKEPDECLRRGSRLRGLGGALWAAGVDAGRGDSAGRAASAGAAGAAGAVGCCGTHSSLRSSSHGWNELPAIVASASAFASVRRVAAGAGGDARFVVVASRKVGSRRALWQTLCVRRRHATAKPPIAAGKVAGA